MIDEKDKFRLDVGRALNVVTATLGSKSFEAIQQEYKDVEKKFLAVCDDSDLRLYIEQNVSERIFGDAVVKNCAMADLEHYYKIIADLGFSCAAMHISSTIIYCQSLISNDRIAEAKRLLKDLLNYVNEIEDANPGTFISETSAFVKSLISRCTM